MELPTYFSQFVSNISPDDDLLNSLQKSHLKFRNNINSDGELKEIVLCTFLQGSYRRHTTVKPPEGKKADVDVVLVTNLDHNQYSPSQALDLFKPFLEKYYKGRYRVQNRSIGIDYDDISLDMVVTAAPSESMSGIAKAISVTTLDVLASLEDVYTEIINNSSASDNWRNEPLLIPNVAEAKWEETHPIRQITWTIEKNAKCNKYFLGVVKAIKWWRRNHGYGDTHPKSYPLECIIGHECPDGVNSVAEGVVRSFENMRDKYRILVGTGSVPFINDHGIPANNSFKGVSASEFSKFIELVDIASTLTRTALDLGEVSGSCKNWREIFGDDFPRCPESGDDTDEAFSRRKRKTQVSTSRFAIENNETN